MSGDPKRQKMLLSILAVLLLVVLWLYWPDSGDDDAPVDAAASRSLDPESASGSSDSGTPGQSRPAPSNQPRQIPSDRVLPLRLADLQRVTSAYTPGRDPWRFVDPPPPPPPPPPRGPTPEELAAIRAEQERLERLRAEALARQQAEDLIPKPPPFTLKYIGNFGPARQRYAVFTDGTTYFSVREGQVFASHFILAKIGYESVDIKFVEFPGQPPLRVAAGR